MSEVGGTEQWAVSVVCVCVCVCAHLEGRNAGLSGLLLYSAWLSIRAKICEKQTKKKLKFLDVFFSLNVFYVVCSTERLPYFLLYLYSTPTVQILLQFLITQIRELC